MCARRRDGGGFAADAAREFFGGIGVFGVGLVAAGLADFGHGAADGVDEFAGISREEARRERGAELLFIAEDAAIDGAGEGERFAGAGHADVNEAALLFDAFFSLKERLWGQMPSSMPVRKT